MSAETAGGSPICPKCDTPIVMIIRTPVREVEYDPAAHEPPEVGPRPTAPRDEPDEYYRPRRRRRNPNVPGAPALILLATTVALLIASSVLFRESWEVGRGSESNWSERSAGKKQELVLIKWAGATLALAHACWFFACLATILRLQQVRVSRGGEVAHAAFMGATIGALVGGLATMPVSQYAPIWGDFLINLAAPWSVARLQLVGAHWATLSIAGAVLLGAMSGLGKASFR